MSEKDYMKAFAKNLKRLLEEKGKTQAELSRDLGLSKTTVSSWFNGYRMPRMDKIELLCNYFNVSKSELLEVNPDTTLYYLKLEKKKPEEIDSKEYKKTIEKILELTKEQLTSQKGLMFDGNPATPEAIESILNAMEIGIEIAKKKNREKYTPKKYKKDPGNDNQDQE